MMLKINLSFLLACLVLLGTITKPVVAQKPDEQTAPVELAAAARPAIPRQSDRQAAALEKVKIKIAKLGVGEKAKATVYRKDGTKVKGYIAQAGDDDFVLRDRKTDTPTTIRYTDVAKVESNRGHSTARNVTLGVVVGVGAVLAVLGLLIASLD